MTIKQQGGVFGRNPTFNNVEIDGTGTVDGDLTVNGFSYFNDRLTVTDDHMRVVRSANTSRLEAGVDATSAYLKAAYSSGGTRDLRFLSLNTEIARITVNGLTFNGDTAAANALDDYEEGTWTPVVTSGSGTLTTVTVSEALYTKIGRFVTVHTKFVLTDAGTGSASLIVDGFPYVINSDYGNGVAMGRSVSSGDLMFGQLSGGNSRVTLFRNYDKTDPITNGHTYTLTATYGV